MKPIRHETRLDDLHIGIRFVKGYKPRKVWLWFDSPLVDHKNGCLHRLKQNVAGKKLRVGAVSSSLGCSRPASHDPNNALLELTSCSGVRVPEKTVVAPVQVTPTTSTSSFQANKIQHTAFKFDGAHGITVFQSSAPLIREQDPKTYAIQTIQGNQQFVQQVPHVVNLHESSVFNSHNEISKMVQKILPPKAFDQPHWTPPSTDYISKPLHCIACNNTINDVESLLVCDACEKGVHMKCLLAYQRIIPKAEWHCSNCLASTHGKSLPPKYGRVTRSIAPSRSTSSPGTVQKTENADVKFNSHQKMISNLKPDILTPSHASIMGHSHTESSTINKMVNIISKQESDLSVTSRNNDVHKEAPPDHSDERADPATIPSSLPDSNQHNLNTGLLPCHMQQQTSECSLETKTDSMPVSPNKFGSAIVFNPASQEPNDSQIINKVEVPIDSNISCKHTDNELNDPSNVKTSVAVGDCDTRGENMNVSQETTSEIMNVSQETISETLHRDCSGSSTNLLNVEWVGDAVRAVEGKSYYESFCLNGFTYKLEDHVFVSSNNGKPSKLQAIMLSCFC
ncbi:hypothetical protein Taro_000375 [Colocasia esculenta]|uniref:PHD-type domain-containing protein n=1 Tax=Colocasia esculenta TaxID=4460 RepID=A0A843TET5_COLES|nr:hypothetical protein [Colocasia esculenta]